MVWKENFMPVSMLQTRSFQIEVFRNYISFFVCDWRRKTEKNGKKSFQSLPVFLPPFAAILIVKFAVATIWKVLSRAFQPYQMLYVKYVGKVPHWIAYTVHVCMYGCLCMYDVSHCKSKALLPGWEVDPPQPGLNSPPMCLVGNWCVSICMVAMWRKLTDYVYTSV